MSWKYYLTCTIFYVIIRLDTDVNNSFKFRRKIVANSNKKAQANTQAQAENKNAVKLEAASKKQAAKKELAAKNQARSIAADKGTAFEGIQKAESRHAVKQFLGLLGKAKKDSKPFSQAQIQVFEAMKPNQVAKLLDDVKMVVSAKVVGFSTNGSHDLFELAGMVTKIDIARQEHFEAKPAPAPAPQKAVVKFNAPVRKQDRKSIELPVLKVKG